MKHLLCKLSILVSIVYLAPDCSAQLIDCNIYLKANHLEIGINNNGAYGTSYDPPSGYHPNTPLDTMYNDCTSFSFNAIHGLGFVVDPAQDGWTTGTPAYFGDFIMPAHPREGWGIADHSATSAAYSYYYTYGSNGYTGPLTGANTAYSLTGTTLKGVWEGTFSGTDTVNIKQTTKTDVANLFLSVHIDFYNVGITADTFYYIRTINPQNEATLTTSYSTKNKIEHQLPDPGGLVVVSATGATNPLAYIALGTKDARAKCFIMRDSTLPGPATYAQIYAGDTAYQFNDSLAGDKGIGLIYKIMLGPGDSTSLDYGYSFKSGIIDTFLDTFTTYTLKTINPDRSQSILVYPNPTNDLVNINGLSEGDKITMYDMSGKLVAQLNVSTGQKEQTISIGNLSPGIYLMEIKDRSGNAFARIPIKKM